MAAHEAKVDESRSDDDVDGTILSIGLRWIRRLDRSNAALAGLVGGVAMGLYEAIVMAATGHASSMPLRMIGSTVQSELARPLGLAAHPVLAGTILHGITAAFWGLRLGEILDAAPQGIRKPAGALIVGLVWGVTVWILMGLVVGPALDPAMRAANPTHHFVAHLVYGTSTAVAYIAWRRTGERASRSRSTCVDREPTSGALNVFVGE